MADLLVVSTDFPAYLLRRSDAAVPGIGVGRGMQPARASAVMRLLGRLRPELQRAPVANTGQMWLLRLGLFELSRPKEAAEDWVWIVDHTVQIGVQKCLLIAGVRSSAWRDQAASVGTSGFAPADVGAGREIRRTSWSSVSWRKPGGGRALSRAPF